MKLRTTLLRWYDANKRDLPWRRTSDPYSIWVSEVMLQQTRVDTVIPYYNRFLEHFPTTKALAEAETDDVMSVWSGLGYYRRARLLQRGAREVVASYGGSVPKDARERMALPGIGRYTAGAIGSIAFQQAEPIVDGNVARVFARMFAIDTPLGKKETEARFWEKSTEMVKGPRPGDLNQALMELGAIICTKSSPSCSRCPWKSHCLAFAQERVNELPVPKVKKAPRRVNMAAVVIRSKRPNSIVLVKNQLQLFRGLWNLPLAEGDGVAGAKLALDTSGISAELDVDPVGEVKHTLSHRALTVALYRATRAKLKGDNARRISDEDLKNVGISSLTIKLLAVENPTNPTKVTHPKVTRAKH